MSNLKALFGIDFSTDLFIESAEMVLPSHLKRAINYKIEGINEITEKFNNQKPYVPKPFGLDIIKKKISEYRNTSDLFPTLSFTTTELKKACYFIDQILETEADNELFISILDENWSDKYLKGLIYFLFYRWDIIEYKSDYSLIKDFILLKVESYQGNKTMFLKLKENLEYIKDGGSVKLGLYLKSQNKPLYEATDILGLKKKYFTSVYFSKVIQVFYNKRNEIDEQIEKTLTLHANTETSKVVLSSIIVRIEHQRNDSAVAYAKSLALKLVGDPSVKSNWSSVGYDEETSAKINRAHGILNRWVIQMYIDVVFDKMIVDPDRKRFWAKYINHITYFKVVGSPLNERILSSNDSLKDSMKYYFKCTTNEYRKKTCALVLRIRERYFIEFSDLGSLYVYNPDSWIVSKLHNSIAKIEDLKDVGRGNLVESINYGYYYNDEGRMVHRGEWQQRLTSWINRKLGIYV